MFSIIDSRSNRVVAEAFDYKEAKFLASQYRKSQHISYKDWAIIKIKKKKVAPVKFYFVDDGCCDSLRDRNCELYGRPHL